MPGYARPLGVTTALNVVYTPANTISSSTVDGAIKELEADIISGGTGAVGGGTDRVFFQNDQTITTDYTITTNKNAVTAGPVTINNGVTVTIPSGSYWVIV